MKLATVDIGTNSIRLLIADYENCKIKNRKKFIETTKLGKDIEKDLIISKEAMEKNYKAILKLLNIAKSNNCEKIKIVGTSALRDSLNNKEFVNYIFEKTGEKINIVSGKEEANLGFLGVREVLDEKKYNLILDIGAGSTEFILSNEFKNLIYSESIDIGALRLTNKFFKNEVYSDFEINSLINYIKLKLEDVVNYIKLYPISKLILIGGTATTISSMNMKLLNYDMNKIHNSFVTKEELDNIYIELKESNSKSRKMIQGLNLNRADIIFAGVIITKIIMEQFQFDNFTVSEFDNLEGMIYSMFC